MGFPSFSAVPVETLHATRDLRSMTPEELDFLKKLAEDVLEIRAMFKRFTTEKQQRWKDEAARRRERAW